VHRAKQIAPRECGWKHGDRGYSAGEENLAQWSQRRIDLTPTGLLMEGDFTNRELADRWSISEMAILRQRAAAGMLAQILRTDSH
jgi:hypothetical protein